MTTWNDILKGFNRETAVEGSANHERFADLFDMWLCWSEEFDARMKKYFAPEATWVCTDTRVGLAVYFLDGEMVAVSFQNARQSDENIQFLTYADAAKVRRFLQELRAFDNCSEIPVLEGDREIHSSWFRVDI